MSDDAAAVTKLPARRKSALLADGSYLFEDELSGGSIDGIVITCAAWLLELFVLTSGQIVFKVGEKKLRPGTNCFGVLYPPFAMCHLLFEDPQGSLTGIAASESLPAEFVGSPIVFDAKLPVAPTSAKDAIAILRAASNRQSVDLNPNASLLSIKAKKLIDTNYLHYPAIARIAERLGVSHPHLTRQFKNDFGMSPNEYLRRLRVADAPLRLARGEEIINVSQEVGYNDLSRFYKQFRKTTNTSPGACKTLLRPDN